MALFKYFKKVEHTVSESANASELKEFEKNEVQKQLQSISEPQPKKKRQRCGNYDKIQQAETLLPSLLDDKILQMIKNMRQVGCFISYNIAIAIGKGIVLAND